MDSKMLQFSILLISTLFCDKGCNGQTTAANSGATTDSGAVATTSSITTVTPIFTTPVLSSMFSTAVSSVTDSTLAEETSASGDEITTSLNTITTLTSSEEMNTGSGAITTTAIDISGNGTLELTTTETGSGTVADTTTLSGDGSDTGTTAVSGVVTETTSVNEGSGMTDNTRTNETTTFQVTTASDIFTNASSSFGNETTLFDVTTGVVATSGLPWYIIVIICLGILILILAIVFIIVCCKCWGDNAQKDMSDKITDDKSGETRNTVTPTPGYVPQAPTIKPKPEEKKAVKSFVSETPMAPPAYHADSSRVRKREKPQQKLEPSSQSFNDDEGFNEPLVITKRQPMKRVRKQPSRTTAPQEQHVEGDSELVERVPQYQQYYLPTPVQTALTAKGLGNALTDDALAARRALQRSDIERHRNKHRLRQRQRLEAQYAADRKPQTAIDAVLAPPTPAVLQSHDQRKKLRIANARKSEMRYLTREKQGRYKQNSTDYESDTSSEKTSPHEVVIAKMAKLLEEAYALLSPAVQKNLIQPSQAPSSGVPTPPGHPPIPVVPPPPPMQGYPLQESSHMQPNERLFVRTQTPPTALLPQQDANSAVWTPYRTFDQLEKLQAEDPSLTSPRGYPTIPSAVHHPNTSSSDVAVPMQVFNSMPNTSSQPPNALGPQNSATGTNESSLYLDSQTEEPASSIVQSIKDSLAKLTGTATPVTDLQSNPSTLA